MSAIFLDLGVIQIYWYSVILFIAFLIGGFLALNESKRWKISEDFMINLFFYLIPIALIGARLYYVLFNIEYYSNDIISIFKIWEGGLAIHGGIIVSLIFIIFYTKKYKVSTLRITDILVVSLIIGQAIGRWGNFMNGEAYGPATTLSFLQNLHLPEFIINGMNIGGTYYHPTFLYESLWCLIGFIILLILRRNKYTKIGMPTSFYLVWYGIGRFLVEGLRQDSLMFSNIRVAQLVSLVFIVVGIFMFLKLRKGSVFQNKYNDERNLNETKF